MDCFNCGSLSGWQRFRALARVVSCFRWIVADRKDLMLRIQLCRCRGMDCRDFAIAQLCLSLDSALTLPKARSTVALRIAEIALCLTLPLAQRSSPLDSAPRSGLGTEFRVPEEIILVQTHAPKTSNRRHPTHQLTGTRVGLTGTSFSFFLRS